jgi:hypothetical protein
MESIAKLFILSALLGIVSCKKKETQNASPVKPSPTDYVKLKPGNYWIYREYMVTDTSETDQMITDSLYVEKDTLIAGKTYHKLVRPSHWDNTPQVSYLTDSLDYIIDYTGRIHFSANDFTTIFYSGWIMATADTVAKVTKKMTDKDVAVATPAGVFITSSFTTSYAIYKEFNPNEAVEHWRTRYARGIGMVTEVLAMYAFDENTAWERRLVRWHVQ